MKFNIEVINSVKNILHIEIPEKVVKKNLDDAYSELKKTAKIKGFRPGKTPRSVLEQLYKKNIHKDVSSQLIQNGLAEALKKSKLKFVGSKKIDPPKLEPTKPYCFDAEIDVKPEINTIDFKGLNLKKTMYKASDEEVNAQLHMLQKNIAKKESINTDRPVKNNDFVVLDYAAFKDGKAFKEAGKSENFTMKIGASSISSNFDKNIEGMRIGEKKEFKVKFPDNYHNKNLVNLEVIFKVKVKDIKEEILPEINNNMAKQLGSFKNLDDLKNKILENLKEGYDKRKEQELNEQIFAQLIDKTEFELPEILVQYELNSIISETERSLNYHNKSLEDAGLTKEILVKKYDEVAKKQVRRQLILGQIIEQEKMEISEDLLEEGFKNISLMYGSPLEKIKSFYGQNPDKLETFKHALLEKKAIDIIINESNIEEIEPTLTVKKSKTE